MALPLPTEVENTATPVTSSRHEEYLRLKSSIQRQLLSRLNLENPGHD